MAEKKKCVVFGATGNCGKSLLQRAIKEGLDVTAFVRKPERLPEELRKSVSIAVGDILDEEAVAAVVEGKDMVFSALGIGASVDFSGTKNVVISQGCQNIVNGMKKHNVKKLCVISSAILFDEHWVPFFIKRVLQDHRRQLELLEREKDSIDWVAILPPFIKPNGQVNENYLVQKNGTAGSSFVTNAEVADCMVKCLKANNIDEYRHVKVGISSGPALISTNGLIVMASICTAALGICAAYYFGLFEK